MCHAEPDDDFRLYLKSRASNSHEIIQLVNNLFVQTRIMDKLVPSNPSEVMVVRQVTPNITTLSAPFNRHARFRIGGRGTLGT